MTDGKTGKGVRETGAGPISPPVSASMEAPKPAEPTEEDFQVGEKQAAAKKAADSGE